MEDSCGSIVDQTSIGSIWYDEVNPEVSIIVLNLNKSALTIECLQTIWRHTKGRRYEVIVVDNGSRFIEFNALADSGGLFRLIRLPKNRYFGEGNNIGVEASRGRYVVFLNNDAFVSAGWLEPLLQTLETEYRAGGVGPRFLYPDGRLQEAGSFIDEEGIAIQRGKFYHLTDWELRTPAIVDYCSAACFATTREILDQVGGFDATYEPAYYEDADLGLKIASLGYHVYYCPDSEVVHVENATSSQKDVKKLLANIVESNKRKFLSRWGSYLAERSSGKAQRPPAARPLKRRRKHDPEAPIAAFHTPYELTPGGGERYILTAAAAISCDYPTMLVTEAPYSSYRLDYLDRELSLDLSRVTIAEQDALNRRDVDIFMTMGNHALPCFPATGRRNFYMCQFPFPSTDQYVAQNWSRLRDYDAILVNSEFTRGHLMARINAFQFDTPIIVLPPPVPLMQSAVAKAAEKPIIVSVGRFFKGGHNKRHDILIDAVRRLTERGVECELHLVGSTKSDHMDHFDALVRRSIGLPVTFHPNASPTTLERLVKSAHIYWHGTGFGVDPDVHPERCEHFGISIVEAMSAGCVPFVVNNGGPTSFVRESQTGFQYTSIEELAEKTSNLIANPNLMRTLAQSAVNEAKQYSEAEFARRWRSLVSAGS